MTESSAWLVDEGDLEAFLDGLELSPAARRKLELGWQQGYRRTVHVRINGGWVVGFSRARYRGDLPPQGYCKRSGASQLPGPSKRLERVVEALDVVRRINGFACFGTWTTLLDSHLKIALRDAGLSLDNRLLHDLLAFERLGTLEIRRHPETREAWVRVTRIADG